MNKLTPEMLPAPHPIFALLQEHDIPIIHVGGYLGCSYSRAWQILKGFAKPTLEQQKKLSDLRERIEREHDDIEID